MSHPCFRCGHNIEDGKPFCHECGAPQIRVILPDPAPALAGHEAVIHAQVDPVDALPGHSSALSIEWSHEIKPCALAALMALVLTFIGLNPFVAAVAAGWLAVVFSRRRMPGIAVRPRAGAWIGTIAGFLLFGMSTIFETLAVVLAHKGVELRADMMDKIQQVAQRYPGPEVQPFLDFVRTPEGFAFMMVGSVIFALIAFAGLGALGGALSAAILRRRP